MFLRCSLKKEKTMITLPTWTTVDIPALVTNEYIQGLIQDMDINGVNVRALTEYLVKNPCVKNRDLTTSPSVVPLELIKASPRDLFFTVHPNWRDLYARAKDNFGLIPCPLVVPVFLCHQYCLDQPMGERLYIATDPITTPNGEYVILTIKHSYPGQRQIGIKGSGQLSNCTWPLDSPWAFLKEPS